MEIKEFIKWYEEQYSSGDLNAATAQECAAFLTGLAASHPPREMADGTVFDPVSAMLARSIRTLQGAGHLASELKRKSGAA
jgi:hypothetical protein